ncbi:MAG: hypothetical protein RJA21_134 [Gemmatimonadota bacterium]
MDSLRLALVVLLLVPAVSSAQRRSRGSPDADWNAIARSGPSGPTIAGKDIERASPLALFIEKKKDLKLSDAQLSTLKEADASLRAANAARYGLVDSLKKEMKVTSGTPSAEDEARVVIARDAMMALIRDVRASYDSAAASVTGALDESQRGKAQELLLKHAEEMQEMLRAKMGGRGPGAAAAPPGRRRG